MRICESTNVWWKSSWMKTDIFLIHIADCKNARNIEKLFQFDLSLSCFIIEESDIHKLRLHKDAKCNDYRHADIHSELLWLYHSMKYWFNRWNDAELYARIQRLFRSDKNNSRHSMKETICWLRMKAEFLPIMNESHIAHVIWCWKNRDDRHNWASRQLLISWKKRLNSENIFKQRINWSILKKWTIQKQFRIEQFNNARHILKQLHWRKQRAENEYHNHFEYEL